MEKVEVKENNSQNAAPPVTGEVQQVSYASGDPMQEALRTISEETLQLSECLWQERKLIRGLSTLLKGILKHLGMSFILPAEVFPRTDKVQQAILSDEAHLILINDKNEVSSRALEDCNPTTISSLIKFMVPELGKALASYRKEINSRIAMFDKVNQELKNLQEAFAAPSEHTDQEGAPVNNGIKKTLMGNSGASANTEGNKESA